MRKLCFQVDGVETPLAFRYTITPNVQTNAFVPTIALDKNVKHTEFGSRISDFTCFKTWTGAKVIWEVRASVLLVINPFVLRSCRTPLLTVIAHRRFLVVTRLLINTFPLIFLLLLFLIIHCLCRFLFFSLHRPPTSSAATSSSSSAESASESTSSTS
jgi:hypothetical protein